MRTRAAPALARAAWFMHIHARNMHNVKARRIAILGASGYSGVELTRLVVAHPDFELQAASSDRWVGDAVKQRVPGTACELRYTPPEQAIEVAMRCDAVLLATPAEVSHAIVPRLIESGVRVVDLSGAFRLRSEALYATYYGFAHAHAGLLEQAVYGLPERNRAQIAPAKLVANPGCYATVIQLALAPILPLVAGRIIVDAASGVTGAGRKATEDMSFAEVAGDYRAYRVLRHQHTPEIEQGLGGRAITFVPHLLPIQRGILATCHAELAPGVTRDAVARAFELAYQREPFVSLAETCEDVTLHNVVGTNRCQIGFQVGSAGDLVVIAAIDNLVKGAAGQAVQNLNLLFDLPETTGLVGLRSLHP
ncbi:MAG: N-acetyl-gamma-glutamyl-phosphate reductase [Myxococcales bacterium]|nr:N-acetyl-gamma-glutamyl-phosphate reductase [Myxococcales bacterium]